MNKFCFICFSVNRWGKRKARKHQFMLHLAKEEDVDKVLYIEPPVNFIQLTYFFFKKEYVTEENRESLQRAFKSQFVPSRESEKLLIFTPIFFFPFAYRIQWLYNLNLYFLQLIIKKRIKKLNIQNTILWIYHPFAYKLLDWFKQRIVSWFDWAEDWGEYYSDYSESKRKKIGELENYIIKNTDIVSTVSNKLMERARRLNENSFKLADGTVLNVFMQTSLKIPEDIKNIQKPILGYLGSVTERIDLELLEFLVEKIPGVSIVLIGNILHHRVDIPRLKKIRNIYLLGGRRFKELGQYTKNFSISILPYKTNLWGFPTKIFDYLAIGKPIVTTSVPELEPFNDVLKIAYTNEEFAMHVRESLEENDPVMVGKRINMAKENSWEIRAKQILETIRNYKYKE